MTSNNKPTFVPSSKEVNSIVGQIEKQQIAVGNHLQNIVLSGKDKVKTIREYMESQRGYVWENWRASNLIQAILLNDPIPEIIIYRNDDKSQFRKTLDGQQRLTTVYLFVNDGFKLDLSKSIYPKFEIEGEQYTYQDLQGKMFSELPELFRDAILNYDLRILTANNCTDEQAERYYTSMNAGMKPLKPAEIRMAGMGMKVRRFIGEVLKSDWVLHTMTAKSAIGNIGSEIIAQVITLMHHDNKAIELSKENIDNVIYSYRDSGIPEEMKENIFNVCGYLNQTTNIWIELKKKHDGQQTTKRGKGVSNYSTYRFTFFNKTHTVMLIMSALEAVKNNVSVDEFQKWAYKFFENPSVDYKKGMDGKVNELGNVDMRMLTIQEEVGKLKRGEVRVAKEEVKSEAKVTFEDIQSVLNEFKTETTDSQENEQSQSETKLEETIETINIIELTENDINEEFPELVDNSQEDQQAS